MNLTAIQTDIQNHGFSDISTTDLNTAINYVYQDLLNIESWPVLQKTLTTTWTAGQAQQFSAVTDIKQVLSLVDTVQGYELIPMKSDDFYKQYADVLTLSGNPVIYHQPIVNSTAPMGWQVHTWPYPAGATACQLRYLYIAPDLSAGTDVPVLPARFHRMLTYGSLIYIYQMEDDTEASMRFQGLYDRGLARMRDDLWSQQFDRDDYILDVTSDTYGWYYT